MDAEILIAALEKRKDVAVTSTELDGVTRLTVRHATAHWLRREVIIDQGNCFWPGRAPIRTGPDDDPGDPGTVAALIAATVTPAPPGWPM